MVLFGSFLGSFGYLCNCLSLLPVEEKTILGLSKMLAIAFPLCLSRERQFQGVARKPKTVPFLPLSFACQGKGYFGTFWECLNSLSSLPVKEKAISGSGQEASERSFSEDPGHQLWPLAIAFSRCLSTKRLFQSSLGMLAMAFPTCLSRKR